MLITVMFSLMPGSPGTKQQIREQLDESEHWPGKPDKAIQSFPGPPGS